MRPFYQSQIERKELGQKAAALPTAWLSWEFQADALQDQKKRLARHDHPRLRRLGTGQIIARMATIKLRAGALYFSTQFSSPTKGEDIAGIFSRRGLT